MVEEEAKGSPSFVLTRRSGFASQKLARGLRSSASGRSCSDSVRPSVPSGTVAGSLDAGWRAVRVVGPVGLRGRRKWTPSMVVLAAVVPAAAGNDGRPGRG